MELQKYEQEHLDILRPFFLSVQYFSKRTAIPPWQAGKDCTVW